MAPALLLSGGSNAGRLSNIFAKLLASFSLASAMATTWP
jgi:hypothetical protein